MLPWRLLREEECNRLGAVFFGLLRRSSRRCGLSVAEGGDHSTYLRGEEPAGSCRWDGTFVWVSGGRLGGRVCVEPVSLDGARRTWCSVAGVWHVERFRNLILSRILIRMWRPTLELVSVGCGLMVSRSRRRRFVKRLVSRNVLLSTSWRSVVRKRRIVGRVASLRCRRFVAVVLIRCLV